jgi:type VI secretion system protein ImpC
MALLMSETTPLEEANVELTSTLEQRERAAPDADDRFRILVLGDFSGRASRGVQDVSDLGRSRTPVRVDRDNLEELPGELGTEARLHLMEHGAALEFEIETLEDFHPDRLFTEHAAFAGLRKTRLAIEDGAPNDFAAAAVEVQGWGAPAAALGAGAGPKPVAAPPFPPPLRMPLKIEPVVPKKMDALVEELLEKSRRRPTADDVDRLVRQVVAPHLVAPPPVERDGLLARADEAIGSWMRSLLHEPAFHDLEAAWRALELLVRRVDEDTTEVHVLDVSRAELAEDLRRKDLAESGTYKVLVEEAVESSGGKPWSVIVGLWTFSANVEDAALLGRLARIAKAAGAPFLATAAPRLTGRDSFAGDAPQTEETGSEAEETQVVEEALWQALRGMPGAEWIGLTSPRILLRLPYGAATDPIEEFVFEEDEGEGWTAHDDFLWGSSAAACALLLSQSFAQDGWDMTPGSVRDVDGLPLYVRKHGDESRVMPCAEALLTDSQAEDMIDHGLMPVVSRRESDTVRFPRFQSIREPATPLAGPWGS